MGIISGAVVFEFLPALEFTRTRALHTLGAIGGGLGVAAILDALVRGRLPERHDSGAAAMTSFVLAVVIDDVIEGLTLGFAGALSLPLLLFGTAALVSKNLLEGFTEATVLRWKGAKTGRIWTAGVAAAVAVVMAAGVAALRTGSGLGDESRLLLFAGSTGALAYVSAFQLARNLEWNGTQRLWALLGLAATGVTALLT